MKPKLLDILVSPKTGDRLHLAPDATGANGELRTEKGELFPIEKGVPNFVDVASFKEDEDAHATYKTFEDKWRRGKTYRDATLDHYREWFFERFGLEQEADVSSLLPETGWVLDAATAHGRDASMYAAHTNADVVGLDYSGGIFLAQESFGNRDNLHFVRADMMELPFREETFDFVACDQALHHTPNTRQALESLVIALKKNGRLLFYVYKEKAYIRELVDTHLRDVTTKLSADECYEFAQQVTELGRSLSDLNVKVDIPCDIPLLGIERGTYDLQRFIYYNMIKCYWNDSIDFENNVLTNFDWYHPAHAHRHSPEEVRGWCEDLNLEIQRLYVCGSGISVIATKTE